MMIFFNTLKYIVGFDSLRGQDGNLSVRHRVQTGSGAHPASYLMDTGAVSLREQSGRGVKLTTSIYC